MVFKCTDRTLCPHDLRTFCHVLDMSRTFPTKGMLLHYLMSSDCLPLSHYLPCCLDGLFHLLNPQLSALQHWLQLLACGLVQAQIDIISALVWTELPFAWLPPLQASFVWLSFDLALLCLTLASQLSSLQIGFFPNSILACEVPQRLNSASL